MSRPSVKISTVLPSNSTSAGSRERIQVTSFDTMSSGSETAFTKASDVALKLVSTSHESSALVRKDSADQSKSLTDYSVSVASGSLKSEKQAIKTQRTQSFQLSNDELYVLLPNFAIEDVSVPITLGSKICCKCFIGKFQLIPSNFVNQVMIFLIFIFCLVGYLAWSNYIPSYLHWFSLASVPLVFYKSLEFHVSILKKTLRNPETSVFVFWLLVHIAVSIYATNLTSPSSHTVISFVFTINALFSYFSDAKNSTSILLFCPSQSSSHC